MLDDPEARREFAREIARASQPKGDDARDVLAPFDRDIVGHKSVMIKLPLLDPVEVRRHLEIIEETCRALRLRMQQHGTDRSHLFVARGVMRLLTQRLNAYRTPRKD